MNISDEVNEEFQGVGLLSLRSFALAKSFVGDKNRGHHAAFLLLPVRKGLQVLQISEVIRHFFEVIPHRLAVLSVDFSESAQFATSARDCEPKSRVTAALAAGESFESAIAPMVRWPSGPQLKACNGINKREMRSVFMIWVYCSRRVHQLQIGIPSGMHFGTTC
jgi:hypothetical protein